MIAAPLFALALAAAGPREARQDASPIHEVRCAVLRMTAAFNSRDPEFKQAALDEAQALIASAQAREPDIDMIDWFEEEAAAIELMSAEEVRALNNSCQSAADAP